MMKLERGFEKVVGLYTAGGFLSLMMLVSDYMRTNGDKFLLIDCHCHILVY